MKHKEKMKQKTKIIFMGTPQFGAVILGGLVKAGYKPVLVVTAPDKPVGRKQILASPPVKVLAEKHKIPVLQPEKVSSIKHQVSSINPDLIISAAFGQILPKEILEIPKYGCLNVHPSLLPKYRGATPIQFAVLNGDKKTGVTIILMDEKIDRGPILAQRELAINSKITFQELEKELTKLGVELLIKIIPDWLAGKIRPRPQDEKKATYTKVLKKEDGKIDWKKTAEEIERQTRAFNPWPGTFTFWQDKKNKTKIIKLLKIRVFKKIILKQKNYCPGKTLVAPQNELCVQTGKGFLIVEKMQLEGKKPMSSEDFIRGHDNFIGVVLK